MADPICLDLKKWKAMYVPCTGCGGIGHILQPPGYYGLVECRVCHGSGEQFIGFKKNPPTDPTP